MEVADWTSLSDGQLLERRISNLGLRREGTALEPLIRHVLADRPRIEPLIWKGVSRSVAARVAVEVREEKRR